MINTHSISFRYLKIIGGAGRFYSEYIFPSHQVLSYLSILLLLIMMFRMNKNLRIFNFSKSSNRFLLAIHWIVPIFNALFRYSFFRKYYSQWSLTSERRSAKYKRLIFLLTCTEILGLICVYSQTVIFLFFHRKFGAVVEIGLGIGASFCLLLFSIFYLRFLSLLKEFDSSYRYYRHNDEILDELLTPYN